MFRASAIKTGRQDVARDVAMFGPLRTTMSDLQRERRDHAQPIQPPIISTPPNGVMGPNTARHAGTRSTVASVTSAMMLQENKAVPTPPRQGDLRPIVHLTATVHANQACPHDKEIQACRAPRVQTLGGQHGLEGVRPRRHRTRPSARKRAPAIWALRKGAEEESATRQNLLGVGLDGVAQAIQREVIFIHPKRIFDFLRNQLDTHEDVKHQHHHGHSPPSEGGHKTKGNVTTYRKMNFFMNML